MTEDVPVYYKDGSYHSADEIIKMSGCTVPDRKDRKELEIIGIPRYESGNYTLTRYGKLMLNDYRQYDYNIYDVIAVLCRSHYDCFDQIYQFRWHNKLGDVGD
jgi:hypothetical protein